MKRLADSVLESLCTPLYVGVYYIIEEFFNNIDYLSSTRKQHFLSRLRLCNNIYKENIHIDVEIGGVIDTIKEIVEDIKNGRYKKIIDTHLAITYKDINEDKDININEDKDRVYEWLQSIKDERALKYLSIGCLSSSLFIVERANAIERIPNIEDIYKIYEDIDSWIDFHNEDIIDCKHNSGTIYVNWLGNLMNILNSNKFSFKSRVSEITWNNTKQVFTNMKEFNNISLYGITHIIINESRFYTRPIDKYNLECELEFLEDFLIYMRERDYKLDEVLTLDLLCECALCTKLARSNKYNEWKNVIHHVSTLINPKTHILQSNDRYINNKEKNIEKNEHCNILFILLNWI